jgi:hypothetical protein
MKIISVERFIKNKYNHLLVVLIVFLLLAPAIEQEKVVPGQHLVVITLILTIIFCLRVTVTSKKIFWLCVSIAIFGLLMDGVSYFIDLPNISESIDFVNLFIICIFIFWAIILLMESMFQAQRVTANTIVGGICVYLLIGILWALFYILMVDLKNGLIDFETGASLFYFSFTTLTTLGYGDIIPKGKVMMMLANFEAISGQIYLAVFIARLVGLHTVYELKENKNTECQP